MARAREAQVIVTLGWRGRGGRFATQTRWEGFGLGFGLREGLGWDRGRGVSGKEVWG